jgi:hypothetical protein
MPHILDPAFIYTPAAKTDIRLTFDRVRREQTTDAMLASKQATSDAPVQVRPPAAAETPGDALGSADLHPRLPAWLRAHAADEKKSLEVARAYLDTDDRR